MNFLATWINLCIKNVGTAFVSYASIQRQYKITSTPKTYILYVIDSLKVEFPSSVTINVYVTEKENAPKV